MTIHVRPFAFDRVFTAAANDAADPAAMAIRLEALEAELGELRASLEAQVMRARAEGYQQALEQVRGERELAFLSAADAIHAALEALDARLDAEELALARSGAELALDAADYLAGRALAQEPAAAVDAAIGRALRQVRRGQPIRVRVHPDLVDPVETLVADRQSRDRRKLDVIVIGDAELVPGDARLSWDDGGTRLDAAARRALIAAELDALYPPA